MNISLRGSLLVASGFLHGIFDEVALAFTETDEEPWDVYDTISP